MPQVIAGDASSAVGAAKPARREQTAPPGSEQGRRDFAWLQQNWAQLASEYVGRHIAVYQEELAASAPDLRTLLRSLDANGIASVAVIAYVYEPVPRLGF